MRTIHFVGFRTDAEYSAAVRVFGKPDFIHMTHDRRMYGDNGCPINPASEVVIFGSKAGERVSTFVD